MWQQRQAVRRMQEYIAAHWAERVTLSDLARVSSYSPWHAHRLFALWTGFTPASYIRRLRLSKSALRLQGETCKIADVAFSMGFGSVDGYQRAFRKEFGCNPGEYAVHPVPIYLFTPFYVPTRPPKEEQNMAQTRCIFIREINKPERKAIIRRGVRATEYWTYCEEMGCDVWGLLKSMPSLSGEPVCMWLPAAYQMPGSSEYVQGVEVPADYDGQVPEGMDVIQLPAARYLLFQGEPFEEEDFEQAIQEVWDAIQKFDPAGMGCVWDDANPRIQLEPIGARGYMELRAIAE